MRLEKPRRSKDQAPAEMIDSVNHLTQNIVVTKAVELHKAGEPLHVSALQDEIEHLLMKEGFF